MDGSAHTVNRAGERVPSKILGSHGFPDTRVGGGATAVLGKGGIGREGIASRKRGAAGLRTERQSGLRREEDLRAWKTRLPPR